jgi:hypothetical protein
VPDTTPVAAPTGGFEDVGRTGGRLVVVAFVVGGAVVPLGDADGGVVCPPLDRTALGVPADLG